MKLAAIRSLNGLVLVRLGSSPSWDTTNQAAVIWEFESLRLHNYVSRPEVGLSPLMAKGLIAGTKRRAVGSNPT